MNDNKILLHEVQRMDAAALARVFDLYATALYKYAYRRCGHAIVADQIVGDVFAKLMEQLSVGCGPGSNLRSYLFEIAHHLVVDHIRYSHRMAPISFFDFTCPASAYTEVAVEHQMLLEGIWRSIRDDLTGYQRDVILLRFMEGFSLKETARILGKTVGGVKLAQNRAVAVLRKSLQADPEIEYEWDELAVAA
jgi:RNA polymerase sigma-70 factor (ECF subfamily)